MERYDSYQVNFFTTYARTFGLHEVSGLFSIERGENELENLEGQVLDPYAFTNGQSTGANGTQTTVFSRTEAGRLSYLGRANYVYADKYLAEFLIRSDASTKFAPENYWGTFYSLSAGWILSEENWFKSNVRGIDYLKMRASYGLSGRDNINAWQWLMTYGLEKDKGPIFGTTLTTETSSHISVPDAVPNHDAHWDQSHKSNLGIDASVLNNKLSITLDGYYEWNRDVFDTRQGSADYPATVGAQASAENYASKDNYGIELSFNWRGKIGTDFKYNIGIMTGYSDIKTLEKAWPAQIAFNAEHPGQWNNTIGSWGYECIGLFRNYQEIEEYFDKYQIVNYMGMTKENVHPGMLIYNNIRGSQKEDGSYYGPNDPEDPKAGYVDGNDLVKINNRSNTWGFTMNTGGEWKGLSLKFQLAASWGGYNFFPSNSITNSISNGYTNAPTFWTGNMFVYQDVLDAQGNVVVPQNLDAKYPNMRFSSNSVTSTFWRVNGARFTLNNITLAYVLPKKITNYLGIESCRMNITGQNMLTLYNPYPDNFYDPMSGSYGNYPNLRRITAGLNITF
jgi:TonB-linked SusC/RagA family outer membrane protein